MFPFCIKLIRFLILFYALCSSSCYAVSLINVYYYNGNDNFINLYASFLGKLSERSPLNFKFHDAGNQSKEQVEEIITDVFSGSPAIVNLVDVNDADKVIEAAKRSGSKVIFFNRLPNGSVLSSYENCWYVGANSEQSGMYLADVIDDYLVQFKNYDKNKNGQLDMVILQGEKLHHDTITRTNVTLNQLNEKGYSLNVISKNFDNWNRYKARTDLLNQIKHVGLNNIEIIFANNDAMALGALDALKTYGYNTDISDSEHFIPIFGVDGLPEMIKEIDAGRITATLISDYSALATVCYKLAISDADTDEEVTRLVWYKTEDHKTLIPYIKYASFKNYMKPKYTLPPYQHSFASISQK